MGLFNRSLIVTGVSLVAIMAAMPRADAGGFAVREQSATAQGLSFAGAGAGSGGVSSIFWNPATVTMKPGWNSEWHFSAILGQNDITPLPPTPTIGFGPSGDIAQDAIVPASYKSYQVNEWLWLGLSSTSPYGLVTKPNDNWAGQVYSRSSKIFTFNVNPIVGVKVTDWLSIGGGPMLEYFDVRLKNALAVAPGAPNLILEGDDTNFGFTAGVNLTPLPGTSIGLGFRSSIHHRLEGEVTRPGAVIPIVAKINTPETLTFGISQRVTPDLTLHGGVEWTNWSRVKEPAIVGPFDQTIGSLPLHYEDGYFYSIGAEYQLTPQWAVRAGLAYEESPITDATRGTRLPDNNRIWASLGASYRWNEKLSFDLAYTHIFFDDTPIRILPGHQDFARVGLPFVADVDSSADIISVAVKYRWDTPAVVAVPAAPIVRKY
jgi:long-chain fatty acid transport protein